MKAAGDRMLVGLDEGEERAVAGAIQPGRERNRHGALRNWLMSVSEEGSSEQEHRTARDHVLRVFTTR